MKKVTNLLKTVTYSDLSENQMRCVAGAFCESRIEMLATSLLFISEDLAIIGLQSMINDLQIGQSFNGNEPITRLLHESERVEFSPVRVGRNVEGYFITCETTSDEYVALERIFTTLHRWENRR